MGLRRRSDEDEGPRSRRATRSAANWRIALLAAAAVTVVIAVAIAVIVLRGGILHRAQKPPPPPKTPEEAWQRLVGTWTYTLNSSNSKSVTRYRFTPDRKLIFSLWLMGGVLPAPETSEMSSDVTAVTIDGNDILITATAGRSGRPGSPMRLRIVAANQIEVEDELVFTREER